MQLQPCPSQGVLPWVAPCLFHCRTKEGTGTTATAVLNGVVGLIVQDIQRAPD